jgi:hypothetical protein
MSDCAEHHSGSTSKVTPVLGWKAAAYGITATRVARRGLRAGQRVPSARSDERLAFVVGSPRSGTTFTGGALGSQPGWVDLGEVPLLKAAVPQLVDRPVEEQASALRRILERVRALGLVRGLRAVEQNPETAYVLAGALRAYPEATAVHVIRDGRDVVCSLLERGWLGGRAGADDANQAFGSHARFWVEPERRERCPSAPSTSATRRSSRIRSPRPSGSPAPSARRRTRFVRRSPRCTTRRSGAGAAT